MTPALAQAADSLAHAATAAGEAPRIFGTFGMHGADLARLEATMHAMERWHEFYLMAGTAAVTLVGLLFVALSFHLDTLLHESKAHLLSAARLTFGNFIYVLTLSLMFLVPDGGPRFMALWVMIASTLFLALAAWDWFKSARNADARQVKFMNRRRRVAIFGYLLSVVSAVLVFRDPNPALLFNFVAPVCMLLGNGAGTAWDLLVQVGRLKLEQERAERVERAGAPR